MHGWIYQWRVIDWVEFNILLAWQAGRKEERKEGRKEGNKRAREK